LLRVAAPRHRPAARARLGGKRSGREGVEPSGREGVKPSERLGVKPSGRLGVELLLPLPQGEGE